MRRGPWFLVLFLLGWAWSPVQAAELVPFVLPWDDTSGGPTDLRGTLDKPAGKQGFVRVVQGQLATDAGRLKLFGANLTAGACFPDHATADKVAARMAKFGLNAVRLHFLDATWAQPGLVRYASGDWRQWDADTLDRLDYFVARLKEQGIYVNLNLLVGRRFGVADGVDPSVNQLDGKAAHAVGFFHAPHQRAQQDYARQLLTHRNPYTGLRYLEDPAVAVVEINNENGLLHSWLGGQLDTLPPVFAADLRQQWNSWLGQRYADNQALAAAWGVRAQALGAEMLSAPGFAPGLPGWVLEQHQGAVASAVAEQGTAVVRVRRMGTAGWHVQLQHARLALRKGGLYTVRFRAWADRERKLRLGVMQARPPWGPLGLSATLTLGTEPRTYVFSFVAEADEDQARFGFSDLNQEGAEFRFSEVSLRPGGHMGLAPGESLDQRNLALPQAAAASALSAGARQDWVRFLWETERAYWRAMRRFLKQDLGVRVPLVGTITATSTPNLMAEFDVVDSHAYWEHPRFPGKPWDRTHWSVHNTSMVDHPERATVASLAFQRVVGKPHMVSEYNHPAPNTHAGEGPLFIAAYGALQDWDALFLYTYSHDEAKTKAGRIPDFFDIGQHPTILANTVLASLVFRRGDLTAARQLLSIPLGPEAEVRHIAQHGHAWGVLNAQKLGLDLRAALRHRVALDTTGKAVASMLGALEPQALVSDTEELAWRLPAPGAGLLELRSPRYKGFVGHADGQALDLGDGVQVRVGTTHSGWATLALALLEGDTLGQRPRRALLVATGYTENTNMGWTDASKSSVGTRWGRGPSLVESVAATVVLPRGHGLPMLYPLDERGQRGRGVPFTPTEDRTAVQAHIGPPHATLWYELVWPAQ